MTNPYAPPPDRVANQRGPVAYMPAMIVVTYAVLFAVATGMIGFVAGNPYVGTVLGIFLGGYYGYLRTTRAIRLGPVWLLVVMAFGGLLAPAVDGTGLMGAILFGLCYGWLGFLSDKLTRILLAAVFGFVSGAAMVTISSDVVGVVTGVVAAVSLHHMMSLINSFEVRRNDALKLDGKNKLGISDGAEKP